MRMLVNTSLVETVKMEYDKIRAVHTIILTMVSGKEVKLEFSDEKEAVVYFGTLEHLIKNNFIYDSERK